jgi:uncharacterized protein YcbX
MLHLALFTNVLATVSKRLPDREEADVTKFRPNIVVEYTEEEKADITGSLAWDEDYWRELNVSAGGGLVTLILTQNCARCVSLNIDYATGRPGTGESGSVLKKLMKDRRVDPATKYSPVFGRYGFVKEEGIGATLAVGDEVVISERNPERTVLEWPGVGS